MPHMDSLTPEEVAAHLRTQVEICLHELSVGYIDLVVLRWPAMKTSQHAGNPPRRLAAWRVLEEYYERGWIRAIGVSNCSELHLEQLMKDGAKVRPMVNQIEASLYLQWEDIVKYCRANGIVVQAYSPLGRNARELCDDPVVASVAAKHKKNPGQIALWYLLQKGYAVTFMSQSAERIRTNQHVFDFDLDDDDLEKLGSLARPGGGTGIPSPLGMT